MMRRTLLRCLWSWLLVAGVAQAQTPTSSQHTVGTGPATVVLAWDPNAETDLAGYVLAWGATVGVYTASVTLAPTDTQTTLVGLPAGTYVFAIRAFNLAGLQSGYSNPVSATLPFPPVMGRVRVPRTP